MVRARDEEPRESRAEGDARLGVRGGLDRLPELDERLGLEALAPGPVAELPVLLGRARLDPLAALPESVERRLARDDARDLRAVDGDRVALLLVDELARVGALLDLALDRVVVAREPDPVEGARVGVEGLVLRARVRRDEEEETKGERKAVHLGGCSLGLSSTRCWLSSLASLGS